MEEGARCVVLASRSGKIKRANQGLEQRLDEIRKQGVQLVLEQCDMCEEVQVVAMLDRIQSEYGEVRVVVHAAGVESQGLLHESTVESTQQVWGPKAAGAWYLHTHAKNMEVFMLYSSVSSLFGNRSQGVYAAANDYLDELAMTRESKNQSTVSIQWPYVADVGMAASLVTKNDKPSLAIAWSISSETVKQVVKQSLAGDSHVPIRSILPRQYVESMALVPALTNLLSDLSTASAPTIPILVARLIHAIITLPCAPPVVHTSLVAHVTHTTAFLTVPPPPTPGSDSRD